MVLVLFSRRLNFLFSSILYVIRTATSVCGVFVAYFRATVRENSVRCDNDEVTTIRFLLPPRTSLLRDDCADATETVFFAFFFVFHRLK